MKKLLGIMLIIAVLVTAAIGAKCAMAFRDEMKSLNTFDGDPGLTKIVAPVK
ncbi:MAG: hypothetical protein Q7R85_04390 [bacterium]|nr:hypothetical protein [bacterium]